MGIFKQIGSLRNRLNPLKALQAGADRIEQHKTEAFIEMDKQIPAPKREIREADRLTDEEIDAKLAELEKKSNFAHDYMDMLDSVQISKPKELTEIDYAFRNKDQLQRPTDPVIEQRKRFELEGTVPRGKCRPNDLVDIIVNNRAEPNHWNIQTISAELKLRESDVENFLTHFDLIDEQAKMVSNSYENDPFTIAEESWDEGRRLEDK